jgi:hypothetical protein
MADKSILPRIKFTEDFKKLVGEIKADNNYCAHEILGMEDPDSEYFNGIKITEVDISDKPFVFNVTSELSPGKKQTNDMKIGKFIRYYFPGIISDNEAHKFTLAYNTKIEGLKDSQEEEYFGEPIEVVEFKYNPKNPRSTFLSLVTKTYPHGNEEQVLKFLPSLQKDECGNYYHIIGEKPKTMFTSHLDTADREQKVTKLFSIVENGEEYIVTDEKSILGADDKAGVTVMLYMMAHNIPGLYYFFIGEERGGIGSNKLSGIYEKIDYLKAIERCVSFDRRNYFSVITHQLGKRCCSDVFANALCKELNKSGLDLKIDTTGIYTDSASFIDDIRECTNISVGYFNEHTGQEYQNITYLESLCEASVSADWNSLPTSRKVGLDEQILAKHKPLIDKIKSSVFDLETRVMGEDGKAFIRVDLDENDLESVYSGISTLSTLLNNAKIDDDIIFGSDGSYIKIELK